MFCPLIRHFLHSPVTLFELQATLSGIAREENCEDSWIEFSVLYKREL
jgi:hypothetical protein